MQSNKSKTLIFFFNLQKSDKAKKTSITKIELNK